MIMLCECILTGFVYLSIGQTMLWNVALLKLCKCQNVCREDKSKLSALGVVAMYVFLRKNTVLLVYIVQMCEKNKSTVY